MKNVWKFIQNVLSLWYRNLKADTPVIAKYIRNFFISLGTTCVALSTGYTALPERVQMIVPDKFLLLMAIGAGLGIVFSQSFKKKEI